MDSLSQELQDFLIRLGKEPQCVSEKVEHYIKHIMHLVYADDEDMLKQYYGLFGNDVKPLADIARERRVSDETMLKIIEDGKYEELLEKNGFFAELVKRQRLDAL